MGNCCHREEILSSSRASSRRNLETSIKAPSVEEPVLDYSPSKRRTKRPVRTSTRTQTSIRSLNKGKNIDIHLLLFHLSNPDKLEGAHFHKYGEISLVASKACAKIVELVKSQESKILARLASANTFKTLSNYMKSKNEELRFWSGLAFYHIYKTISPKESTSDVKITSISTWTASFLNDSSDFLKYLGMKFFILIIKNREKTDDLKPEIIVEKLYSISNANIFSFYADKLYRFCKWYKNVMIFEDLLKDGNKFSVKTINDKRRYYSSENKIAKIKYIIKLRKFLQEKRTSTRCENKKLIENMIDMDESKVIEYIADTRPTEVIVENSKLFPLSCVGTYAVVKLISLLMENEKISNSLCSNQEFCKLLVQNLSSEIQDLYQYSVILSSHIFHTPSQDGLCETFKTEIIHLMKQFLVEESDEIRYVSGLVIRNCYSGSFDFPLKCKEEFENIVKNTYSLGKPLRVVNNFLNAYELIVMQDGAISDTGLEIFNQLGANELVERVEDKIQILKDTMNTSELEYDLLSIKIRFNQNKIN